MSRSFLDNLGAFIVGVAVSGVTVAGIMSPQSHACEPIILRFPYPEQVTGMEVMNDDQYFLQGSLDAEGRAVVTVGRCGG